MEVFAFRAANKYLGIEGQYVHRVVDDLPIAPVPFMPPCHAGLIYFRGELFDVIDLSRFLGDKESEISETKKGCRVILLKWAHRKLALIPEEIVGMIWIETDEAGQTVETVGGDSVQIMTPDDVWSSLTERHYGPHQI